MKHENRSIDYYAQSFFAQKKSIVASIFWFAMFNICLYLEMSSSSKSTILFGNFSSPLSSFSGVSQRFFFYFYWIGSALIFVTLLKNLNSIVGKKKTGETEISDEPLAQDNLAARKFFTAMIALGAINIVVLFSIILIVPSDKSIGQVFKSVLETFVY